MKVKVGVALSEAGKPEPEALSVASEALEESAEASEPAEPSIEEVDPEPEEEEATDPSKGTDPSAGVVSEPDDEGEEEEELERSPAVDPSTAGTARPSDPEPELEPSSEEVFDPESSDVDPEELEVGSMGVEGRWLAIQNQILKHPWQFQNRYCRWKELDPKWWNL